MTKIEIQTLYEVMFTDYPDIVNVAQVQAMLGISRHAAYDLLGTDRRWRHPRYENRQRIPRTENQCDPLRTLGGKSAAGGVAGI